MPSENICVPVGGNALEPSFPQASSLLSLMRVECRYITQAPVQHDHGLYGLMLGLF